MKTLFIAVCILVSTGTQAATRYYQVPATSSQTTYTVKKEIIGYKCPGGYYLALKTLKCMPYETAEAELEHTTLKVDNEMGTTPCDVTNVTVVRE